ncbi:MAG: Respiratory-chain dehydrogenase domain 51 kDa subunit [Firmicutes bacterium]|nr:Respiratory-chain dehydrogenase domain 51 kDa subunit [Bacillota bacterium]
MMVEEILAAVKDAGVVGAGGAGFPTHVKIKAQAELVIANGSECEPLLRTNEQLMIHSAEGIINGLKLVMTATGAKEGVIGLKEKHTEAVRILQKAVQDSGEGNIRLFLLSDMYPAGDEQVLVYEVTGRIVPEGGIPLQVGVVVSNVETLLNVAEAVKGHGVIEKYVTVTGAVNCPVTLKVPVGTFVHEMIAAAGGTSVADYAIIDGGPMMGKIVAEGAAVTKLTGGLIVLPLTHTLILQKTTSIKIMLNRAKAICCSCRACTESCPRHLLGHSLEPHRIMQVVGSGTKSLAVLTQVLLCSQCGVCDTFGCIMGLSPRRINQEIKEILSKVGLKKQYNAQPVRARNKREYHLVPTSRIVSRLGLGAYNVPAPLDTNKVMTPGEVAILLSQHIGAPSVPVVQTGEWVSKGQLIAAIPEEAVVGANIHASIEGSVDIRDNMIVIRATGLGGRDR